MFANKHQLQQEQDANLLQHEKILFCSLQGENETDRPAPNMMHSRAYKQTHTRSLTATLLLTVKLNEKQNNPKEKQNDSNILTVLTYE